MGDEVFVQGIVVVFDESESNIVPRPMIEVVSLVHVVDTIDYFARAILFSS